MNTLGIILSFIFAILIFRSKGEKRLTLFFAALFFLPSYIVIIDKPQMPSHRLFVLAFFFSLWYHHEIRGKFPMSFIFITYLIATIIINIQSEYLTSFYKFYKPIIKFFDSYFLIFIGYYGLKDCKLLNNKILIILGIIFGYGIFCYFTSSDPYSILFPRPEKYFNEYLFGDRKRIVSTWDHPIPYVYICGVLFYLLFLTKTKWKYILLLLSGFTIIFGGVRSALLSWLFMGAVIPLFGLSLRKNAKYIAIIFFIGISTVILFPEVQNKFSDLYYSVSGDENKVVSEGSSKEMRQDQMDGALGVAAQFPLTGGGIDYVQEQLMTNNVNIAAYTNESMFGFESYLFILLIERGILGVIVECAMMLSIVYFFVRYRKLKLYATYGIAITFGFYIFAILTGDMGAWKFPMLYVGAMLYRCESYKEKELNEKDTKSIGNNNSCI